nr:hypothetical protein [Tanacetum cinerariifolium]
APSFAADVSVSTATTPEVPAAESRSADIQLLLRTFLLSTLFLRLHLHLHANVASTLPRNGLPPSWILLMML